MKLIYKDVVKFLENKLADLTETYDERSFQDNQRVKAIKVVIDWIKEEVK